MHETVIAKSLLEIILDETKAETRGGKPVAATISCGVFDAINDEILCFAFEAVARGGICEGMKLTIVHRPVEGRCRDCEEVGEFDIARPRCPNCGGSRFEIPSQHPSMLEEIEFETE